MWTAVDRLAVGAGAGHAEDADAQRRVGGEQRLGHCRHRATVDEPLHRGESIGHGRAGDAGEGRGVATGIVQVRVVESGNDGASSEIAPGRRRRRQGGDLRRGADRNHAITANGQRLGPRVRRIAGEDVAVQQHGVGRRRRTRAAERHQTQDAEARPTRATHPFQGSSALPP